MISFWAYGFLFNETQLCKYFSAFGHGNLLMSHGLKQVIWTNPKSRDKKVQSTHVYGGVGRGSEYLFMVIEYTTLTN